MNSIAKTLLAFAAFACPLLAFANAEHEGHELAWDLHNHNYWLATIAPFVIAMAASSLVFRFAFKRQ